jgi:hypothetical protein
MGKGGGGGPTQSTGTTYTTNLPEYAQPYVETMLGATQRQLFQTQPGAEGTTEITGFQPYTPYSTDPSKYVAGFSPLQTQAQQTVAGMQTPGAYGQAQGMAGLSGMGQMRAGTDYLQGVASPGIVQGFMSPYQQAVTDVAKSNAVREAQIAQQQSNLGAARQGTYGGARQALQQSERERNLLTNLSGIQAQGSQAAYDKAMQTMQYGAGLNLQGLQGAAQTAGTIGSLAGQQFGTQKDIVGLQQQAGGQQQQQQQQIINQAIQDYANAQQYPMMQLGFMSNMLRGLPMQSTSTQQYVAAPNQLTQGIGALGAGANIYSAFSGNPTRAAEGGQIKSYAKGGIASYDVGGNVKSDLSSIRDPKELREIARNTTSNIIREEALRFAKMREMGLAGGGIVAFADGKTVRGMTREDYTIPDSDELKARREADIAAALALQADRKVTDTAPTASSIMFDQMKNRPTSVGIPMLEKPENFKVDATAADTPAARPQKGYEALLGIKPDSPSSPSRSISEILVPRGRRGITQAVNQDVKEKVLAPVVENAAATVVPPKKDEAPLAAPAEKDTGIKAVANKDEAAPAVVPSSEGVSKGRANIPGLSPTMQALYDRSTGRQQTIEEIMAEQQAMKDKYVGPDTRPEERARLMAEKVNMKEEDERNRRLQLAQFFASWGSTPGSTLQAAMVAVNKHIPTIIASDKEARKAQNEVDKIIRELNKAERLEKEGDLDGAYKIKTEQSKKYEDLNKTLMTYVGQKEAAAIKATGTDKITQQNMLFKAQDQLGKARRALTDLPSKNKELYAAANSPVLEKESKILTDKRDAAKAKIAEIEAEQRAQIEEAQNTIDAIRKQGDIVVPAKKDTQVATNTTVKKYNKETGRLE